MAGHTIGPLHALERTSSKRMSVGWRGLFGLLLPHRIQIMVVIIVGVVLLALVVWRWWLIQYERVWQNTKRMVS